MTTRIVSPPTTPLPEATPPSCHPSPGSTPRPSSDRGRTWCVAASRDNVPPRSQTHAPGGGGNAGQATAPCGSRRRSGGSVDGICGDGLSAGAWDVVVRHRGAGGSRGPERTPAAAPRRTCVGPRCRMGGAWDVVARQRGAGGSRERRRSSLLPPGHELLLRLAAHSRGLVARMGKRT